MFICFYIYPQLRYSQLHFDSPVIQGVFIHACCSIESTYQRLLYFLLRTCTAPKCYLGILYLCFDFSLATLKLNDEVYVTVIFQQRGFRSQIHLPNLVYIFNFEIKKGRNLTHKHTIFKWSGEHEHWNSIGVCLSQFWSVWVSLAIPDSSVCQSVSQSVIDL